MAVLRILLPSPVNCVASSRSHAEPQFLIKQETGQVWLPPGDTKFIVTLKVPAKLASSVQVDVQNPSLAASHTMLGWAGDHTGALLREHGRCLDSTSPGDLYG